MFYKQGVLANFWGRKRQGDFCQSQAQRFMLLRCAYEMSDKQFVYADRAVFSTSKVC